MLHRLVSLALVYLLFSQASSVHAHPVGPRKKSSKNFLVNVTTLRTVHTTMTGGGPVTETCDITLTPITDSSGHPAVEEVRKCFLTFEGGGGENGPGTTTVPITSSATTVPISNGSPTPTGSPTPIPVTSDQGTTSTAAPTPTLSSQPAEITSSTGNATPVESSPISVTPAISTGVVVVPSNDPNTSPPSPTPSSTSPVPNSDTATPTTTNPSGTTAAQSSGTSAADSTPSSTAAFQLPGKKLSVLPIGLGVFAGISVIALIVVGLVTYERTKYRKAFRQRKLAESGVAMGYGGMAQRP